MDNLKELWQETGGKKENYDWELMLEELLTNIMFKKLEMHYF